LPPPFFSFPILLHIHQVNIFTLFWLAF
jgi:hypothetical protein